MLEGAGGGAAIGFSVGGPIGAAIGAAAGFVAGLFGGGEKRRREERERRARLQETFTFQTAEPIARSGAFGFTGEANVETDLTGRARAIGANPTRIDRSVNIKVEAGAIQMLDGTQADDVLDRLTTRLSQRILLGGSQLADNIAAVVG